MVTPSALFDLVLSTVVQKG
uniref:Uncharacterized protein n=1 Tax=Arundo donax TaxID=35708 RepID=A0A0A9CIK5_ARUDO